MLQLVRWQSRFLPAVLGNRQSTPATAVSTLPHTRPHLTARWGLLKQTPPILYASQTAEHSLHNRVLEYPFCHPHPTTAAAVPCEARAERVQKGNSTRDQKTPKDSFSSSSSGSSKSSLPFRGVNHKRTHKDSVPCSPQTPSDSSPASSSGSSKSATSSFLLATPLQASNASCTATGSKDVPRVTVQHVAVLQVNLVHQGSVVPAVTPASLAHVVAAQACHFQALLSRKTQESACAPSAKSACEEEACQQLTASTWLEDTRQALLKAMQHGELGYEAVHSEAEQTALSGGEPVQSPVAALQEVQPHALRDTAIGGLSNLGLELPERPGRFQTADPSMLHAPHTVEMTAKHMLPQSGAGQIQQLCLNYQPSAAYQQCVPAHACNTTVDTPSSPPYQSATLVTQLSLPLLGGLPSAGSVINVPVGQKTGHSVDSPIATVAVIPKCPLGKVRCTQ